MTVHAGLARLKGEQLSAVSFVMDYVELHFDGPVVRAISHPIVTGPDGTVVFPQEGSRDALCELIGHEVRRVELQDGTELRLAFHGDVAIVVPLDAARSRFQETMHFQKERFHSPVDVWEVEDDEA